MNDEWNAERANLLLRAALAEIDEMGDRLSPARAEALLDEFEQEIGGAFLRQKHVSSKYDLWGVCAPLPSARRGEGMKRSTMAARRASPARRAH